MRPRLAHATSTLAVVLLAAASGCGRGGGESPEANGGAAVPRRIVSLSCAATDVFDALGELQRLVAVEEDCPCPGTESMVKILNQDHPGKVGAFSVETLLTLRPDAVVAKPDLERALVGRGLRLVWAPSPPSYDSIPVLVERIAGLVGAPRRGEALLERMREKEADLRRRTRDLPKVRVYFETTGAGWTSGSLSIIHEMIGLAGGENIAGGVAKANTTMSVEAILAADPEVIVLGAFADAPETVRARPGWDRIRAVRAGRVHQVPVARRNVTLATPRCVDACEEMLLPWLHPEAGR